MDEVIKAAFEKAMIAAYNVQQIGQTPLHTRDVHVRQGYQRVTAAVLIAFMKELEFGMVEDRTGMVDALERRRDAVLD